MKTDTYIESSEPTLHAVYRTGNEVYNVHRFCGKCAPDVARRNGWPQTGRTKIDQGNVRGRKTSVEVVWGNRPVEYCDECNPFADNGL